MKYCKKKWCPGAVLAPPCWPVFPNDSAKCFAAWQPRMYPQLYHRSCPSSVAGSLPANAQGISQIYILGLSRGVHGPPGVVGYLHAAAPEISPCRVFCICNELTVLSTGRRRSGGQPKRSGADDVGVGCGEVRG